MENIINVLIAEVSKEIRNDITDVLSNVEYIKIVGEAESVEETFLKLDRKNIDVILIGSTVAGDGYKVAEKVNMEYPEISVVMIEEKFKEDTLHKALFAGAKDVLLYPFTPNKLVDTVYRSYELVKRGQVSVSDRVPKTKKKSTLGSVINIFSTKGGVGKTFISTNLAVALKKETGKRVVLVDLDLDFGNVALALNMTPKFTLSNIIDDIKNIDQDLMESYLIQHESGISILPANTKPQLNEFINGEHIQIILRTLQKSFDYIIVDMPARFYEPINPSFVIADKLFMITTPEISTIRNVKSALMTLNELNYPKSKIKVLLNRADSRGFIKQKDVEATLNQDIFGSINYDYKSVVSSLNEGVTIVEKNIKNGIGKEFINIAKKYFKSNRVLGSKEVK